MTELPADFDPAEYLRLHRDVAAARLDAGYHYLKYGRSEGRPYRQAVFDQGPGAALVQHIDGNLKNSGFVTLNNVPAGPAATIIVTGIARGGTSMIGAVLDRLGIFLGDKANRTVYEDLRIANALEKAPSTLGEIIRDYDAAHQKWAFKRPMAFSTLPAHWHEFRHPRLVVCFRDPLAVAIRNNISMNMDLMASLGNAEKATRDLLAFVRSLTLPTLLISYEKALASPASLVDAVATFAGMAPTDEQRAQALASIVNGPEGYLMASRRT